MEKKQVHRKEGSALLFVLLLLASFPIEARDLKVMREFKRESLGPQLTNAGVIVLVFKLTTSTR